MPTFTQYIDVDIEIEEFIDELSTWEIEELVDLLRSKGHLNDVSSPKMNIQDIEWSKTIDKLSEARLQLTVEEEELIKNIANKL